MANLPFRLVPATPRTTQASYYTPIAQTPMATRQQAELDGRDMQEIAVRNRVGDHPVKASAGGTTPPMTPMNPWPAAGPGGALPFRVK